MPQQVEKKKKDKNHQFKNKIETHKRPTLEEKKKNE